MKHIVRWTVHPGVATSGLECLALSINCFRLIYGDQFEYYICTNSLFSKLESYAQGVTIIDQSKHAKDLPLPPKFTAWKYYPPRLNREVHELVLDNDVVLYARPPSIDQFLDGNYLLALQGNTRHFGQFDSVSLTDLKVNTGIMGYPPGYDLQARMAEFLRLYCNSKGWSSVTDDQGALAGLMTTYPSQLIPLSEVRITNPSVGFAPYGLGAYGMHFIGCNHGKDEHFCRFMKEEQAMLQTLNKKLTKIPI